MRELLHVLTEMEEAPHGKTAGISRRGLLDLRKPFLNAKGDCLACLLRTGLEETAIKPKPGCLEFGDSKSSNRRWFLLGTRYGAIGVNYVADKVYAGRRA